MVPFRIGLDALKILQESGSVVGWENLHFAWFQSWFDKFRCEDLFTSGDAVDFQRLQRRDSQKLKAVRRFSKRQTCMFFFFSRNFLRIEFWGARLGGGVASGAPGDRTSRPPCGGWRGWEALGPVIPRAQGHRGAALNQCIAMWQVRKLNPHVDAKGFMVMVGLWL